MGVLDKVKSKISSNDSTSDDSNGSAGATPSTGTGPSRDSPEHHDTKGWVSAGQGGERKGEHTLRAGSLTNPDSQPAMARPELRQSIVEDMNQKASRQP